MAKVDLPRYLRGKAVKAGIAYFWEPPHWARPPAERHGQLCPVVATALGTNLYEAVEKANHLNEVLDGWRHGHAGSGLSHGSVAWLFQWYQTQRKFTKNKWKTRSDYRKLMDAVSAVEMKVGTFGQRDASRVGPEVADKLHEIFTRRGERQALYMVQVCRAVWNWARRYATVTSITGDNRRNRPDYRGRTAR